MPNILTSCPVKALGMGDGRYLLSDAKGMTWRMTEQEILSLRLLTGPFHNDDCWLRQHFGIHGRLRPIAGLTVGIDLDMAGNFLIGACEMAAELAQRRVDHG